MPPAHKLLYLDPIHLPFHFLPPYLKTTRVEHLQQTQTRKKKNLEKNNSITNSLINTKKRKHMEAAHLDQLEDDVFFKDLSKQISLLIMDDGDDEHSLSLSLSHPSVNLQAFTQAINPATHAAAASFFSYDHQQTGKRESKGTGVFIPRSTSNPRRSKNVKQARFMASGNNRQLFQRPCDDHNSRGLPHNNMINPSCDHHSFNFRRF